MKKSPQEWFNQADYDLKLAHILYKNRRYIHCVFMCHLAVEKAIKGLYTQNLREIPPKTHNLVYLSEKSKIKLNDEQQNFISILNGVSVPTRYPEELEIMKKDYNNITTKLLIDNCNGVLKCLKQKLEKS